MTWPVFVTIKTHDCLTKLSLSALVVDLTTATVSNVTLVRCLTQYLCVAEEASQKFVNDMC